MDEIAMLVTNALVSCHLDYYNSFSEVCPVSICTNYSVFKTHSEGLLQTAINIHGHLRLSNNSIGCQLNFAVFSKLQLWVISFFTVVIQANSVLFFLFIVEYTAQDITDNSKNTRFLEVPQYYASVNK